MRYELYHHGIKGQRWGVRRFQRKDGSLTPSGKGRYSDDNTDQQKEKHGLSDKQKNAIKIGSAVGATALVAYGTYKLKQSGKLDKLAEKGKSFLEKNVTTDTTVKEIKEIKAVSKSFEPSGPLRDALHSKSKRELQNALIGYMDVDPHFKDGGLSSAMKYLSEVGVKRSDMFDEFNPALKFVEDRSQWDKEYYNYARLYLQRNFCEKRLDHVKDIAQLLYHQ